MSPSTLSTFELVSLVLRPIVRFCVRRDVKFQDFSEVTRHLFIESTAEELKSQGFEANVSRLSVSTGMHRRDVTRIWKGEEPPKEPDSVIRKVIGQWRSDKRFAKKAEHPNPLSLKGKDSEFAELVRSVSQDVNPYTVLFELERIGAVEKSDEMLILKTAAVSPQGDIKRGLELLSHDSEDLISSVEQNLFDESEILNHHVKTHYDNIAVESIPTIKVWLLEQGAKFHEDIRRYLSKFDLDINPALKKESGGARVAFGSFSVTSPPALEEKEALEERKEAKR